MLRKQVEAAGEEWETKAGEWEAQHRAAQATITSLRDQNQALRAQVYDIQALLCVVIFVFVCICVYMSDLFGVCLLLNENINVLLLLSG